jgi:hypothetical protein
VHTKTFELASIVTALRNYLWRRIGHCYRCARTAFITALCSWGAVALVGAYLSPQGAPFVLSLIAATLLTLLWVAHLVAFSIKDVQFRGTQSQTDSDRQKLLARRAILPAFAASLALVTAATVFPSLANAGQRTKGCCLKNTCADNQYCETQKCECRRKLTS